MFRTDQHSRARPLRPALVPNSVLGASIIPAILAFSLQVRADDAPPDVADVPSLDLRAKKNDRMRYFLVGLAEDEKAPEAGRKLLVVLPGGSGSAEQNPFVRRIWKHALGKDWLVAQLVAPEWSEGQHEKIVWPTKKNPWPKMEFSTEEFIDLAIEDVRARAEIDPERIFVLAWSSSGPAAYAYSLAPHSKASGTFVAMSVFKPQTLPALGAAKGRAYYLLHSPDDFIPIAQARAAKEKLEKAGAKVELVTYDGGHGWRGNVYGNIRLGLAWLEENRPTTPEGSAAKDGTDERDRESAR